MEVQLDEKIFSSMFAMMVNLYGHNPGKPIANVYWSTLKEELTNEEFKAASSDIIKNFTPTSQNKFPGIPEFLKSSGKTGLPKAKNVIAAVKYGVTRCGRYDSVNFGDSRIHQTIKYYGGWLKVCDWTEKDWAMKEKSFIETYNAMKPDSTQTHLPGIHEHNNVGKFDIEPPKLVYKMMKEKPVEMLEFNPRVKVLPQVQQIPGMDEAIEGTKLPF